MPVNKDKTVRTSIIVPADTYREVQELAAANDVSAAWIMRHALLEFLRSHQNDKQILLRRNVKERKRASGL